MMARSTTRSNQRPDTLMQDRICQVDETSCNARPDHTLGQKRRLDRRSLLPVFPEKRTLLESFSISERCHVWTSDQCNSTSRVVETVRQTNPDDGLLSGRMSRFVSLPSASSDWVIRVDLAAYRRLPPYPSKQTSLPCVGMSQMCQTRKSPRRDF